MRASPTAIVMLIATALAGAGTGGAGTGARAQQPTDATGWGTQVERSPGAPAPQQRTSVVPRPESVAPVEVRLSAALTDDGQPIDQGLVWRVFQDAEPAAGAGGRPRLVDTRREAGPVLRLAPGRYAVNVAFGRANLTRQLDLAAGATVSERFVLNAGGLRIMAVGAGGEPVPEMSVSYDLYRGEADQAGGRPKVVSGARPGLIVRLNAGTYHVVSVLGDANAIVRTDVTVEPGKITEAQITHHSARILFKLVARAGGEAIADTRWVVQTPAGETIVESTGALASHILAAGPYVVSARHADRTFRREFVVEAGDPVQVEVVTE